MEQRNKDENWRILPNCQAFCSVPVKIAVKRGLNYFAQNRLSSARCVLLFSCQNVKHFGKLILVFVSESFDKTSVVIALFFFAPKRLSSARSVLLVLRQKFYRTPWFVAIFNDSFQMELFLVKCTKCFTSSVVSLHLIRNTISKNVHGNRGAILTTHSMEEADALCSRVGIMVKGQLK